MLFAVPQLYPLPAALSRLTMAAGAEFLGESVFEKYQ
jgi:hypothetical protein